MAITLSEKDAVILYAGIALSLAGSILANLLVVYLIKLLDLFPNSSQPIMIVLEFLIILIAFAVVMSRVLSKMNMVIQKYQEKRYFFAVHHINN